MVTPHVTDSDIRSLIQKYPPKLINEETAGNLNEEDLEMQAQQKK
jgi:hypothetical protein